MLNERNEILDYYY